MSLDQHSPKIAAYFSAAFTFIMAALVARTITLSASEWDDVDCDRSDFRHLNVTCVHAAWNIDNKLRWYIFSINVFGAIAPALVIPFVLAYQEVFSRLLRKSSATKILVPFMVASAATQVLQFAMEAGLHTFADHVHSDFTLNDEQLISLSLSYLVARSLFIWLFAMDLLFLGIGLCAFSRLAWSLDKLPKGFSIVGWIAGVFALLNFCFELARFGDWRLFSAIGGFTTLGNLFVIVPLWLIWGACLLNRFKDLGTEERHHALMGDEDRGIELGAAASGDVQTTRI